MLAKRSGFVLVYAEQSRTNNPNRCFNWFRPHNARRGSGEALSIRQMVTRMRRSRSIDPARIFITGLSAGGAMTSVMWRLIRRSLPAAGSSPVFPRRCLRYRQIVSAMKRPQPRTRPAMG